MLNRFARPGAVALPFVVVAAWAFSAGGQSPQGYVPNQLIVKFDAGAPAADAQAVRSGLKATVVKRFRSIGAELWEIDGVTVADAVDRFKSAPGVAYIEPNYVVRAIDVFPNDPRFAELWGLHNTGQTGGTADADIDAPEAWSLGKGGDVLVGVIDTGVDYNHADLAANIFTNPGEIPANGLDDDNNGFVDDVRGWDFVNNDNNPMDDNGHGTHVSGTIAAVGNNGIGVVGVSWSARILPLKFLDAGGGGSTGDAIQAVEYATAMGARLTNNSWGGGGFSNALRDAIAAAGNAGSLFVAAAGNAGSNNDVFPFYPASYDLANIISVASTDHRDLLSGFSNFGLNTVDLGAPGSAILSTFPGNTYGTISGTSMATPHVAGALCLVWAAAPTLTHLEAKGIVMTSVDVLPSLTGRTVSGGRLNVHTMLSGLDDVPPGPVVDLVVQSTGSNTALLTWTATGDDGAAGTASAYDLRYSTSGIYWSNFASATPVPGTPAPKPAGTPESFEVSGLDFNTKYYFALVVADEQDNRSWLSNLPNGTTLGIPAVAYAPADFASDLFTGGTAAHILTVGNTGEGTLDFQFANLPGWASAAPPTGRVYAGQSTQVEVRFDATGLFGGDYQTTALLSTNDPAQPTAPIALSLHVTAAPDVSVSPSSLDYGVRYTGTCAVLDIVVTNIGTLPLTSSGITIDDAQFTADASGFTLAIGASRAVAVTFCPVTVGPIAGNLTIHSDDPDHPGLVVPLAGEGLAPPVIAVSPSSLSADLFTGGTSTQALTVANQGGSDLTFEIDIENLDGATAVRLGTAQSEPDRGADVTPPGARAAAGGPAYAAGRRGSSARAASGVSDPAITSAAGMTILLLYTGDVSEMQAALLAFPDVSVVDAFNGSGATPTLELLSGYDGVILVANTPYGDAVGVGNVLADYVDAGGGVVMTLASFISGWDVRGRFFDGGYYPFTLGSGPIGSGTMSSFDPLHPIMAGVGSAAGELLGATTLAPGALWVADWNIGQPFIATQGERVVGANVFVADGGYWSGDVPLILHNAVLWAAGAAWLSADPTEGVVPAGASLEVAVTFDAAGLPGGDYAANLRIPNNDPFNLEVVVPASLHVTGAPDVDVSETALAFGPVFIYGVKRKTLVVSNRGTEVLNIASIASDHADYVLDVTYATLAPGAVQNVVVSYFPSSTGPAPGTLTITSDDPDEPTLEVAVDGEGILPPIISVTPGSLEEHLFTGATSVHTLTIGNNGANNLEFQIDADEIDLLAAASVRKRISIPRSTGDFPRGVYAPSARAAPRNGAGGARAQTPAPLVAAGTAFSTEAVSAQAARFHLNTPESLDLIGPAPDFIWAGDFGAGDNAIAYAVNDLDQFMSIDTLTGNQTILGTITPFSGEIWTGMAFDPTDKVMYATSTDVSNSSLYVIDVTVPSATRVGPIGSPGIIAVAVDDDGNMFAHDIVTDELISIDKATGVGTPIGSLGFDANFGQGMGFDVASGQLYLAAFNNQTFRAELRVADRSTGATALVGVLGEDAPGGLVQLGWLAIPGLGGVRWLAADPSEGVVPPGTSMEIAVTFDATGLFGGDYLANLHVASNDPVTPLVAVPATLHVTGAPDIAVSVTSFDFGPRFIGAVANTTIVIKNEGTDVLNVASIAVDHGDYAADAASAVLAPGASRTVVVSYAPSSPGPSAAVLTIASDDPDEPSLAVSLQGAGVEPPIISVSPASLSEDLLTGETAVHTLTISNSGVTDLVFEIDSEDMTAARHAARRGRSHRAPAASAAGDSRAAHERRGVTPSPGSAADGPAVLVIQDFSAWGVDMAEFILENFGIVATVINARDIATTDFEPFDLIVTVGDQDFRYYREVSLNVAKFESYVAQGGVVQYQLATQGDDVAIVGGAEVVFGPLEIDNLVTAAGHPIVAGLPTILEGNFANHTTLAGLPGDATVITTTRNSGHPTTAEYRFGGGSVVVTGMTWEFLYNNGFEAGAMLGNAVAYSLTLGGVAWLGIDPSEGVVPPGGSMDIAVTFDATDLLGGDYAADVHVKSNDPLNPDVLVPAALHVTGVPDIAVSDAAIDYGPVFLGVVATRTVTVSNDGTDLLTVASIATGDPQYTVDVTNAALAPGESRVVTVSFAPAAAGIHAATLSLTCDDPDEGVVQVALLGQGLEPPVIAVSPTTISEDLFTGAIVTRPVTIDNSAGGSVLNWSASTRFSGSAGRVLETSPAFGPGKVAPSEKKQPSSANVPDAGARFTSSTIGALGGTPAPRAAASPSLESVLAELNSGFASVTSLIPNRYDFTEGETGTGILDGGNDMYDGGNFLGTNLAGPVPYSNNAIASHAAFGPGGRYFTRKYPGLFVMAADINNVADFRITGNLGADGAGSADGAVLQARIAGIDFYGFVKRVYNAFDPSVNHLILVEANPAAHHEFATYTDDDYHRVIDIAGSARIYYLLYASASGGYVDDAATLAVMQAFLGALKLGPEWLSISPSSGAVPAGAGMTMNVTLDAAGLEGGDYDAEVVVESNDPVSPEVVVSAHMHVTGVPDIAVSHTVIPFGQVFVGATAGATLGVLNQGTDDLIVGGIATSIPEIAASPTQFVVQKGAGQDVVVSFSPSALGLSIGTLTIASNDPDEPAVVVYTIGEGIAPPVISVSPGSVHDDLAGGESSTHLVTVSNVGANTLQFSVAIEPTGALAPAGEPQGDAVASGRRPRIVADGGGPDYFGYRWRDSNEPGGPTFAWIDAGAGTDVVVSEDGFVTGLPLGFNFRYYGFQFTSIGVGADGWLSFAGSAGGHPVVVPQRDVYAGGVLAPYARDLSPSGAAYIRYLTTGSTPNRRFVVEYNQIPEPGGGNPKTFEVILTEGTNAIHFQYLTANDAPVAIGIESPDEGLGMGNGGTGDLYIDPALVQSNYAIEFIGRPTWMTVSPMNGSVPAGTGVDLSLVLNATGLTAGDYDAELTIMSNDPTRAVWIVPVTIAVDSSAQITGIDPRTLPTRFGLHANRPNPFNPITTIAYDLPARSDVRLVIFDVRGRAVRELVAETQGAGRYTIEWDGRNDDRAPVSSGVYFYRFSAGGFVSTRKMVLLK